MDKILGIIFIFLTIVIGLINKGIIVLDEIWIIAIALIQIGSLIGNISLMNMRKKYKVGLIVISICAFSIIGLFYILQ